MFINPVSALANDMQDIVYLRSVLERLMEIYYAEKEENINKKGIEKEIQRIQLTNVSFKYFKSGENILKRINISIKRLSELMLDLQSKKANNINLVTPTHFVPSIIEAIKLARRNGLTIPIVYNTSGYESVDTIKLLDGYVDIYLTDFKYFDDKLGEDLSKVKNYFEVASTALDEMYKQVSKNKFSSNGLMTKGIIVRCLVLPTKGNDTKKIINYLYQKYQDNIYLSIMNQYTPVTTNTSFPFLNSKVSEEEYDDIIDYALDLGVKNAYIQEGDTSDESFIPPFDLEGL